MMMMCHCRFIKLNTYTTVVEDTNNGGGHVSTSIGVRVYGKSLYLLFNFALNLKLLLKEISR